MKVLFILINIILFCTTASCESLSMEQKIEIFGYLIKDNDPMFYIYLMNKILSVYHKLVALRTEEEIKLYVELLIIEFYKN